MSSTDIASELAIEAAFDASPPERPLTIIERRPGWQLIDLGELWKYRELLYFLAWRDVKVRYKQTLLGMAWALLQPLATMVIFSFFFGGMAKMPSAGLPYPLFVFAGLLPWTFFSNAVSAASQSVVTSQNLITKVYFPRLLIPIGTLGAGLVDFGIAFAMFLAMMAFYGVYLDWRSVLLLAIMVNLVVAALGVGTWLAALTVAYRDFRHAAPFLIQLWLFATPSVYMHADSASRWELLLPVNPAYGLIVNFRAAALGQPFDIYALSVSSAASLILFCGGCLYFRRTERKFADVI